MAKFRKRPVVVEAVQYDGTDVPGLCDCAHAGVGTPHVHTLEGALVVSHGDWIITGVKGEHYPCKPDIFAETYEPADVHRVPSSTAPHRVTPPGDRR